MTTYNSSAKNTDNCDLVPKDHRVMVSYRGIFKSVTSEYLLNWIERFYSSQHLHPNIKLKCVFRVSVELIQNLIHHSKNSDSFFFISSFLDDGVRSSHGGGGMGLLDLTKISCGNIQYEFLPWSQDKLLFCLTIQLHSTPD